MNITIPRAATWPPYVWDTTDPDEMAEVEAWVRSLIAETAPESRQSDETDPSAQSPQNDPQTPHRRNNGVSSCWRCGQDITVEQQAIRPTINVNGRMVAGDWQHSRCPDELPPPHPTDVSIAWGISEALIEDRGE